MTTTILTRQQFSHTELDKLLLIMMSAVLQFIYVDNVMIVYNTHSTMWDGFIYGNEKDEN